jgi:hypothetical protein
VMMLGIGLAAAAVFKYRAIGFGGERREDRRQRA